MPSIWTRTYEWDPLILSSSSILVRFRQYLCVIHRLYRCWRWWWRTKIRHHCFGSWHRWRSVRCSQCRFPSEQGGERLLVGNLLGIGEDVVFSFSCGGRSARVFGHSVGACIKGSCLYWCSCVFDRFPIFGSHKLSNVCDLVMQWSPVVVLIYVVTAMGCVDLDSGEVRSSRSWRLCVLLAWLCGFWEVSNSGHRTKFYFNCRGVRGHLKLFFHGCVGLNYGFPLCYIWCPLHRLD